jgi:hypothetical protein
VTRLSVIVDADTPVDASLVAGPDEDVLVLSPHQSFESAVDRVLALVPAMRVDEVRRLVRNSLPHAATLSAIAPPQHVEVHTEQRPESRLRHYFAVFAVVLSAVVLPSAAYFTGHTLNDQFRQGRVQALTARFGLDCQGITLDHTMACSWAFSQTTHVLVTAIQDDTLVMTVWGDEEACMIISTDDNEAAEEWGSFAPALFDGHAQRVVGSYVVNSTDPVRREWLAEMAAKSGAPTP